MSAAGHGPQEETYTVHVLLHKAEEGGYWAEVLELPGCMSQGETKAEALHNVERAFRGVVQSYIEDGEEIPFERSTTVESLRVLVPT